MLIRLIDSGGGGNGGLKRENTIGSVDRACRSHPGRDDGAWILTLGNDAEEGPGMGDIGWTGLDEREVVENMIERGAKVRCLNI